jgi:urea transporter
MRFINAILKGIGQIFLQENSYTGLFFLAGIFYNSVHLGLATLVGTIASTATAILFKQKPAQVSAGLFGFNGALTGLAIVHFLPPDVTTWIIAILASACSTIFMIAMVRLLDTWKLPTLTAPFVFTTLIFLLIYARFGKFQMPTAETSTEGLVTVATIVEGIFNGIAQVCFQDNAVTGALFALGLMISSRRAGAMALLGSFLGLLVAWGMGVAEPAMRSGVFGFSPVLTAVALGSTFLAFNTASFISTVLATILTVFVSVGISAAFEPLGLPGLTLPFVVVVWIFILAIKSIGEKNGTRWLPLWRS